MHMHLFVYVLLPCVRTRAGTYLPALDAIDGLQGTPSFLAAHSADEFVIPAANRRQGAQAISVPCDGRHTASRFPFPTVTGLNGIWRHIPRWRAVNKVGLADVDRFRRSNLRHLNSHASLRVWRRLHTTAWWRLQRALQAERRLRDTA